MPGNIVLKVIFIILLALFSACSAAGRFEAISPKFLEDIDVTKKLENMPFQHSWIWNEVDKSKYDSVYIAPIRTDTLDPKEYEKSISSAITSSAKFYSEAGEIAKYFRDELIKEINNYPKTQFKAVDQPGPKSGTISIAITELVFSHPLAQAGALASPIPGTGAALDAISTPHAAFALRFTDSNTNLLIATVAARKYPPARLVDLNKLTVTSSTREICSNWAKELAEALNKGNLGKVSSRGIVSMLPW